ncbi:enoyl-CoA hydratase-related protein [Mycobacterium leprae]|uniref:enoyl-CoA hydratase-related protein n=1 Tax=Mycobacterium leprae TaxID=1769 RepID=UPI0027B8CE94|nr:enoyl-CoA hydratase-related protein [Mycobacterium leprae]
MTSYCLGSKLKLVLAADIGIANSTKVFEFPEIEIGILYYSGGITRLTWMLGTGRTRAPILCGKRLDMQQYEQWGILIAITVPGEHLKQATAIACELDAHSPLALNINNVSAGRKP